MAPTRVSVLDRDELVLRALARLAAYPAWNAADIRDEAERLIAADGVVATAAVRIELAEDLAARALGLGLSRAAPANRSQNRNPRSSRV